MRYSKARRQEIVREFAVRHNGQFNAALFLGEVREAGEKHEAYAWFEWDADKAAQAYQLEQARDFARDLRVSFKVEEIAGKKGMRVREAAMPMVLSPLAGRNHGGGYYLTNTDDPAHMAEHCRQAAVALRAWIGRYEAALIAAGGTVTYLVQAADALEKMTPAKAA